MEVKAGDIRLEAPHEGKITEIDSKEGSFTIVKRLGRQHVSLEFKYQRTVIAGQDNFAYWHFEENKVLPSLAKDMDIVFCYVSNDLIVWTIKSEYDSVTAEIIKKLNTAETK